MSASSASEPTDFDSMEMDLTVDAFDNGGDEAVAAGAAFRELGLAVPLVEAIVASGYTIPTPIQAAAIPELLAGRDLLGQAQTGTGKTAAFALPLLQRIDLKENKTQLLVLAPTRELAIQVSESFEKYASRMKGLRVSAIYGGAGYNEQFRQLDRGAHIVVGTPGRVMDHLRRESLSLADLRVLVLDEADEMLRMGFADDVDWIMSHAPTQRQTALFSATMPPPIREIANKHLKNPAMITIKQRTATADTVRQRVLVANDHQKRFALARVLEVEPIDAVIIFVRTKNTCDPLAEFLSQNGHRCAALHGDIPQKKRERVIEDLKEGRLDIIVATDVAARGLDVQRVSHVFNYDLPFDREAYVHRIGRTGRAGRTGEAILICSPRERGKVRRLEQATGKPIEVMDAPSNRELNQRRIERFHVKISEAMQSREMETFTSIVSQYQAANPDATPEQIAAALAVMLHGGRSIIEKRELAPVEGETRRFDGPERAGRPGKRERLERRDRAPDRGERSERPRRTDRAERMSEPMDSYRIEVGREHGVLPGNIVGAIANEIGIEGSFIGRIAIFDRHSIVDLPEGLPEDMFQALGKVQVLGNRLNISRARNVREQRDFREPSTAPVKRPKLNKKAKKRSAAAAGA
jgi:ATP-dependent RNA helicase DeaD